MVGQGIPVGRCLGKPDRQRFMDGKEEEEEEEDKNLSKEMRHTSEWV